LRFFVTEVSEGKFRIFPDQAPTTGGLKPIERITVSGPNQPVAPEGDISAHQLERWIAHLHCDGCTVTRDAP
jgi:2-keto-3-deoxy-6-phosphogluconate aldolase